MLTRSLRVQINGHDFALDDLCPEGRRLLLLTNGADLFLSHAQFSCARCRAVFNTMLHPQLDEESECVGCS